MAVQEIYEVNRKNVPVKIGVSVETADFYSPD